MEVILNDYLYLIDFRHSLTILHIIITIKLNQYFDDVAVLMKKELDPEF
jgi:hypothetical protein